MGDVPGRGTAVCAGEPRRAAEGCAEGVAGPARGVRAGCEGVGAASVACGAWCAQVGEGDSLLAPASSFERRAGTRSSSMFMNATHMDTSVMGDHWEGQFGFPCSDTSESIFD